MKKFFAIAALVFAVGMTACTDPNENPYDSAPTPVFTLSTSTVEVPQAGGEMSIPFTIENPGEWAQLRATTSTKWIKNLAWDQENGKITFTADANNSDDPLTGGVITVSYDFKEYNISVTQLGIAYDYKWTVPAEAMQVNALGYANEDLTGYALQTIVMGYNNETMEGAASLALVIPYSASAYCEDAAAGTYQFDANNTLAVGSIINAYSFVSTDVAGQFATTVKFASGTVAMTKEGFVARMFDVDGKSYRIECAAVPHVDTPLESMYKLDEITGDFDMGFDQQQFYLMASYYGDYYADGTHNYTLKFMGVDGMTEYSLDLVAAEKAETDMLPLGEFTISSSVDNGGVAYPGGVEDGYIVGCYTVAPDFEAGVFRYGFMKSGKITISTENPEDGIDAIYKIEIEAYDDHHAPGYKISGTYEGWQYGITDHTEPEEEAAAAPAKKAANKQAEPLTFKALR